MQTRKRHSQFKYTKRRLSQSEHKKKALTIWTYKNCEHTGKRQSQSEHTKGGGGGVTVSTYKKRPFIVLTCIHEKLRRLQSEHTQKRYSQSEHARIWNRITASILKQDPNTKRFKRTLTYYVTDTQYAKSYFRSCVRVEVAVLGCPS